MLPQHSSIDVLTLRSPKPSLPPAKAYEPPEPLSQRELGPPPPGYGRYADFDRGAAGGGPSHGPGQPGPRRNLDEVLCFKVRRALSTR
jgi:cleavage and polyadenylation specificity factor subunit 4